jgi:SagB-type dehydrogenase family enzyme
MRTSGHYLDWNSRPAPFKQYKNLASISLPHNFLHPTMNALKATRDQTVAESDQPVTVEALAEMLFFSAGLTRRMRFGSEHYYMRAASATGALYPIELYVICSRIKGLDPGVYHFNPLEFTLVRLRQGDWSSEIATAIGESHQSVLTIVFTSLAWRNAWKYEARSYRHWFWDAGVIIANLLSTCSSEGFPIRLVAGFVDKEIDRLLGLRSEREATVAIAEIGKPVDLHERPQKRQVSQLEFDDSPPATGEVDYPIIWETNSASQLHDEKEVETWTNRLKDARAKHRESLPVFPLRPRIDTSFSLANTILLRGSSRRFAQKPISFEILSTIIDTSTGSIPLDFLKHDLSLIEYYLIVNDVDGLGSGTYHVDRDRRALEQLKEGRMRYFAGYLSLEQHLFSDASAVFFLMTDLNRVLKNLGDRGYRAAQLEAGIRAGKIYLSSYALGIGASGSTFYDDAVTEFFSPHAEGMNTMMEVGVGVPAYKSRPGKILPQFTQSKKLVSVESSPDSGT